MANQIFADVNNYIDPGHVDQVNFETILPHPITGDVIYKGAVQIKSIQHCAPRIESLLNMGVELRISVVNPGRYMVHWEISEDDIHNVLDSIRY